MLRNRYVKWGGILGLLVLGNLINYFWWNWGLITVKVTDAPLGKVINSIEWQGWVKIYTNLPPDSKVSMFVDHVPLAEAMETLAANVDRPPRDPNTPRPARPDRPERPDSPAAPGSAGDFGGGPARPAGDGPPGGGGGGFGGGAQWNLAFFVAPTSAEVRQEIHAFEAGDIDDDQKIYSYMTPMGMISNGPDTSASDPRLQSWPGLKPVDLSAAAADTTPPDANKPPTVHTYLQALAEGSNIWIMAPGSWSPEVTKAPPQNPSIIQAVKNLVYSANGSVTQAIILRFGAGGHNRGDFAREMDNTFDRLRNAIQGLPPEDRPEALAGLQQEMDFRKQIEAAPPEQRRGLFRQHMMEKMLYGDRMSRLSPAKRAKMYQRMVQARQAARGQK